MAEPGTAPSPALSLEAATEFRGSISRRLTVLAVSLFVLFAVMAGLSVYGTHRIQSFHAENQELERHIRALDRLASNVLHLRAEAQDALFLGRGLDDPNLEAIPRRIRDGWAHFERRHFSGGPAWSRHPGAGSTAAQKLADRLMRFLDLTHSVFAVRREGGVARRRLATTLHAEAHRVEEALASFRNLHHALLAERSLAARDIQALIRWTYWVFLGLGALAVGAGSVLFVRRMAIPLRRLNVAAADVARGAFDRRVPVTSRDEIGMLAHTFNAMAEALEERDAAARERALEAEALHRIGAEISSSRGLDHVLKTVVESARSLLRTEAAAVCLRRDGGGQLDVAASAGPWGLLVGGRPSLGKDGHAEGCGHACPDCHAACQAQGTGHLSVALSRGDQVVGFLCVVSAAPRAFGEAQRKLLGGLAAQAAIAIQNVRLRGIEQGTAVVEERERLAREMHDGLAQALGLLHLKLGLAERALTEGATEPARRMLAEMRKVAGDAYDEVRQAIFGLRPMVSRGLGLVPTLAEYLHEFGPQAGLQVTLEVPEGNDRFHVAPEAEVQLVRIVQEALHNVRKHAGARIASVRLRRDGEAIVLAVEDDGVGFDPAAPAPDARRHFGLATMRERAESLGGALTVQSLPGLGTRVTVRIPLATALAIGKR